MEDLKIKKMSSPELVSQSLQSQIASGKLAVGDKLPSENDMATMFGVSRLTVRLAIQKLNAMGVLDTRQGSGTYVKSFSFDKYLADAATLFEESGDMRDICDFRSMLEPKCAELAVKKATPQEIDTLFQLSQNYKRVWTDRSIPRDVWFKMVADADVAIHEQICRMSHNNFCIYAFSIAKEAIHKYIMFCLLRFNPDVGADVDVSTRKDIHYEICTAIRDGNADRAMLYLERMANSYTSDNGWSMILPEEDEANDSREGTKL